MSKDDRRISDDRIKEKCFRYFRGESTYEDEVSIRESLSDGKLSMDDFRTMEKDWCDSERPTAGQRMAYARLTGKIKARRWKRLLLRISVPAAAAVAVIVALFFNLFNDKENPVSTFSTAYLETRLVVLPDSSKVWLNSATTLTYDSDFNKKGREVTLSGEAFFDVSKNPAKPFIVRMDDAIMSKAPRSTSLPTTVRTESRRPSSRDRFSSRPARTTFISARARSSPTTVSTVP